MSHEEIAAAALDQLAIELPSWGFANTGTRFGKFLQAAAATTLEEKFADAAQVHALTGACPTLALHVLWDLPGGIGDVARVQALERQHGVRAGVDQPEPLPGPALQARLGRQPRSGGARRGARAPARERRHRP